MVTTASNWHDLDPTKEVDWIGCISEKRTKTQIDCTAIIKIHSN